MRLLDTYITKFTLRMFLTSLTALFAILFIVLTFDMVDDVIQNNLSFMVLVQYLFFKAPELVCQISPIAILLSSFLVIGSLQNGNEFLAMLCSGLSMYRVLLPILMFGVFVSFSCLFIHEICVPFPNQVAKTLHAKIKGSEIQTFERAEDVWIKIDNRRILNTEYVNTRNATLYGVSLYSLSPDYRIVNRIEAKSAQYKDGIWIFKKGVEFKMQGETPESEFFDKRTVSLGKSFSSIKIAERTPEEMSFSQLRKHIKRLTRLGVDSSQLKVDLHAKISFPFANLILLIIGIPIALKNWIVGKSLNVAICIVMAFFFWVVMSTGVSLGHSGIFPPIFGAWFANIIFCALGTYMFTDITT